MKMNVLFISLMQLGGYRVVTKSYGHEFLKSKSVATFPQIMLGKITENTKKSKGQQ